MDLKNIPQITLSKNVDHFILAIYVLKSFLEIINIILLSKEAINWKNKCRSAKDLENLNGYKESMLHYVKYSLSALILSSEFLISITSLIPSIEYHMLENAANNYFSSIVPANCSMYNSQTMVCMVFLGPLCLSIEGLTAILISSILSMLVILSKFFTTAYLTSKIDIKSIKRSFEWIFWRNLIIFTLYSVELTYILGVVTAYLIIIYQILIPVRRSGRNLLKALVAKGNDIGISQRDQKYLKSRVRTYKWGFRITYIPAVFLLITLSMFTIFEKGIFKLFFMPCWANYFYSIQIPTNIQTIASLKDAITNVLRMAERLSLIGYIVLSILMNLVIQISYVIAYVKRNRMLGKHQYRFPGHVRKERR
ncbi:hypothetical protein LOD99_151 [Oopsacas minuta]|uniref:Odorant receptor n=1 Tax=Oopsacas minuta TaxID=111878 RepID=A0AAV7K854_9METZ|nr:hypothetical protein LOD99_151 [Oopsacas minuta]